MPLQESAAGGGAFSVGCEIENGMVVKMIKKIRSATATAMILSFWGSVDLKIMAVSELFKRNWAKGTN